MCIGKFGLNREGLNKEYMPGIMWVCCTDFVGIATPFEIFKQIDFYRFLTT